MYACMICTTVDTRIYTVLYKSIDHDINNWFSRESIVFISSCSLGVSNYVDWMMPASFKKVLYFSK